MAPRPAVGSREIEAAKKRLAAAKAHAASSAKSLESAKRTVQVLQYQHEDSKREVAEAETFLKETEKRCEVVDLLDDDLGDEGASRKKQRSSVCPCQQEEAEEDDSPEQGDVEEIVVEGCGISDANGTYERNGEFCDYPQYTKRGWLEGSQVKWEICRFEGSWYLGYELGANADLYRCTGAPSASLPPKNGWLVWRSEAIAPAPQLNYILKLA